MKHTTALLQPDMYYHIYNRGNNRENLFVEERNYPYFLRLYAKHIEPIADTYAYCLLKNHFHFCVKIKMEEEFKTSWVSGTKKKNFNPFQGFSNLFNAYAKTINKAYDRTGSLFEERFGRIPVTETAYLETLIFYIHYNPQKHGFVADFRDWQWSSYHALVGKERTRLQRTQVLDLFGDAQGFEKFHREMADEKNLAKLIDEEFDIETSQI